MSRVSEILREAREQLGIARVGLEQAKLGPYHVKAGFRNVAIYGRMVTFCTNNLRGKVEGFDDWDGEAKSRLFDNDIAKIMKDARNQFEKQASNPIYSSATINLNTDDIAKLPRPDNATAFFIGDRVGGSGWMLKMENGDEFPFYVDLPPGMADVKTILADGHRTFDLIDTAEKYLAALQSYLDELQTFVERAAN